MNRHMISRILRPRLILPLLLAAALFMVALSLGDLGQVVERIKAVPLSIMGLALLFAAGYLLLKGLQLHLLLADMDAHPGWRRFVLAFAIGELALTFPLGVFAQNWVLAGGGRVRFGQGSAATVVMLVMEVVVALLWLAVCGIPSWPEVRWGSVALLAGMALFTWAVLYLNLPGRLAGRIRHRRVHRLLMESAGFLEGIKRLGKWRVLGYNLLITPAYLGALGAAFWVMAHGMGVPALGYREAASIYAFAMAVVLVTGGLFGQIGTVEVLGMSVAKAFGLSYTEGLALMLGFRLAWTGSMWLLNGAVVLVLWHKVNLASAASSVDRGEKTLH